MQVHNHIHTHIHACRDSVTWTSVTVWTDTRPKTKKEGQIWKDLTKHTHTELQFDEWNQLHNSLEKYGAIEDWNSSISERRLTHSLTGTLALGHTCREKALSAGMGMRAAMKNAVTLLMEVRATLAPVLFRHSPVRSWKTRAERKMKGEAMKQNSFNQILAKGKKYDPSDYVQLS